MALNFRLKANTAPPGQQCLTTFQAVLNGSAKYLEVIAPDGFSGVIISEDEPGVDDRDKSWIRLEENGKPRGIYVYDDGWVLVPGIHYGAIISYTGDVDDIPDGWLLCDGLNGAPDFTSAANHGEAWYPPYNIATTTYERCPIWFAGNA